METRQKVRSQRSEVRGQIIGPVVEFTIHDEVLARAQDLDSEATRQFPRDRLAVIASCGGNDRFGQPGDRQRERRGFGVSGAFYYLRVSKVMYFDDPATTEPLALPNDMPFRFVLSANGLGLLALGILGGPLMAWCLEAVTR